MLHEVEVEKGGTAIYSWTNPTRPSDDTYTYSFAGWDKTLENVQESFSTKAIYNEIEKYTEGLQFEVNQSDGYSVVGYSGTSRNLIIPNKYSGKPVNRINDLAFANKNVSTLVIPNSITQIGTNILLNVSIQKLSAPFLGDGNGNNCYLSYFFGGVSYQDNETIVPSSLSEVTITGNRDIGQYAFYSCYLLTKVTISGEITQIGKYAFGETSALNSIILSNTISDIEDHAFYNSGLKSITIPEGVSTIKESCFERCNVLQYVIVSNADLLSSQLHAFYQCHNLKTTYFNGRLEQWKNVSFQEYFSNPCCYGAKAYVKDSNGNYIEAQNCINYHIIVPNEITTLSDETLASYLGTVDYSLFESIYVPDSINTINEGVLENFTNLKTISLPFIGINRYRQTLQSGHFGIIFGSESTSLGTTNYTSNYSRSGDSFYATPGYDYGYCHYSSVNRSDGKYQVFETTYGINFHYPSTLKNIIVRSGTIYAYAMYKINVENLYLFDDVIVENLAFSAAKITNLYTNLDIDTSFATNVFSLN